MTVEIVDAALPEDSREVLNSGDVPVRSLAFLPGDERLAVADREGSILILDTTTGRVLGRGRPPEVRNLYSSSYAVYSSSDNDFRIWDGRPAPAKHWSFLSRAHRVYGALGAADSRWRWLAVPYSEDSKRGIELREIESGEDVELESPKASQ